MRKQGMGGNTGNICRRFSKDFPALLLCSLHKRNPLLAKSWQWEKSTNWEGKQNSVEKWKDRFASRQVSVFFGTSVKFHGIETTWHWKLKNAHLTVFTRKPVVNPCQYMLWMCRGASGDKCKHCRLPLLPPLTVLCWLILRHLPDTPLGKAPLLQINAAVENHKKAFCSAYMKIYRGLKVSFSMTYGTFDSTVQKFEKWSHFMLRI